MGSPKAISAVLRTYMKMLQLVARQAAILQILTYVTAHHAFANHIHYVDNRGRC